MKHRLAVLRILRVINKELETYQDPVIGQYIPDRHHHIQYLLTIRRYYQSMLENNIC